MDEFLIKQWNDCVEPEDSVYHLGDFCFVKDVEKANYYVSRLNGKLHMLRGNHDKQRNWPTRGFSDLGPYHELKIFDEEVGQRQFIVLCHYAFQVWNRGHYGAYHLHGHSHGNLPSDTNYLRLDVGVDVHNYRPISFEEVKKIMMRKNFIPIKDR